MGGGPDGKKQATSTHPTQSEAAEEGRNLARSEETEFFLHAQDGRVREHRNYGAGHGTTDGEASSDRRPRRCDAVTGAAGDAVRAVGATVGPDDASSENTRQPERLPARQQSNQATRRVIRGRCPRASTMVPNPQRSVTPATRSTRKTTERLGKPDDLFLDEDDNLEYVGVQSDARQPTPRLSRRTWLGRRRTIGAWSSRGPTNSSTVCTEPGHRRRA